VPPRQLSQLRVVGQEHVQAVLDVEPFHDARAEDVHPRRREAAALRGDAHGGRVRVEGERVVHGADHREALVRLPRPLRVENRDDGLRRVAQDPAHRLSVVRVGGLALGEYQPLHGVVTLR